MKGRHFKYLNNYLVLRDRHGATTDFKLTAATQAEETPIISQVVASDAVLCTDGGASLKGLLGKRALLIVP